MPGHTSVTVPARTWTKLNDTTTTHVTFQNLTGGFIRVTGTSDTTAPTTNDGGIGYPNRNGEKFIALPELFPGVTGVAHIWAWSTVGGEIVISYD